MSSATLLCIAAASGVPLFIRQVGPGKPPPYALIASLNGVHVFGEAQGVTLWKAKCYNCTVIWKTFHNSIRLILIRGSEADGDYVDHVLLDLSFSALILLNGLENVLSVNNVERLKNNLKLCYPLLDEILSRGIGLCDNLIYSHLSKCAEYILPPDQLNIQPELDKYTDGIESSYGCLLLLSGQILFATKNFWNLSRTELVLLPLFLSTKPVSTCVGRDIPVYLPDRSPNVPFRLLVNLLAGPLLLISLCGPTPSLRESMKAAASFWSSHFLTLDAIVIASACSIPSSIHTTLDKAVQGLLLVNYDSKRCLSCVHFREKGESRFGISPRNAKSTQFRMNALASVYRCLVGTGSIFQPPATPPEDLPQLNLQMSHVPVQAYLTTDEFKVVVLQRSPYHILVLFPPLLPLHIAREITTKTLDSLTKNKGFKM